jgi:hypothetical protein
MKHIIFIFLTFSILLSGCVGALKARPAEDAGFLPAPQRLSENNRFPFHAWWVKRGAVKTSSGKLFVAPVNTAYLNKTSTWSTIKVLSEEEIARKAQELGEYFRDRILKELEQSEDKRFSVVDSRKESDGVLEVAIVELVPTDVVRNAAGSVLGFLLPGGGLVSAGSAGVIAIEGRFIETKSGEVVAEFKDRETARIAPIDLAGLTPFRQVTRAVEDWAEQIVEILQSPPRGCC